MFLFIISAIEGFTEFLPVSSTAHMLFFGEIFKLNLSKTYLTSVQLGAMFAILFAYPSTVKEILQECVSFKFIITKTIFLITLPTILFGFVLHFFYNFTLSPVLTCLALIIGGIVMLKVGNLNYGGTIYTVSTKQALLIGIFQCLSFMPGVSRSLAVVLGCIFCKVSRWGALKISVMSGFPVIFGATALEVSVGGGVNSLMLIHMFVAFVFALLGILLAKLLTRFGLNLKVFGCYRIIIGLVALLLI